jgi:hypothetical protein
MNTKSKVRPDVTRPCLLVLNEKHGRIYFHIPDEKTLHKVALDILMERVKAGYWYPDPVDSAPESPGLTKEQVDALPEGSIKSDAQKAMTRYQGHLRQHQREFKDFAELQSAITNMDGKAAWRALRQYGDGEYAGVSLERYSEEYYKS